MKLNIDNLCVSYDTDVVLKDLSLSIREGELISLLGPSGCGKSTLLKTIAGIVPAETGTISLGDTDITHTNIHKRGTVVVFQDMRLFPHMTVLDNVAFPLKMQGISKPERRQIAQALLEKVQMGAFAHRLPITLSGGQQQRIALARALAAKPKILLLDEPFSALDENLREEMRLLVKQLHREFGMTTILVTHDREEALSMSDQVAMMFEGKIHQFDTPSAVYTMPLSRQVADYFGDCLYLTGHASGGQFRTQHMAIPTAVADGDYQLLLRPGDLILDPNGDYPVIAESLSYRGDDLLVRFRGKDGLLWKKALPADSDLSAGKNLRARIHVSAPILFPIDGSASP